MGKFLVQLPLLIALLVLVLYTRKFVRQAAKPMGADDKAIRNGVVKAFVYVIVAIVAIGLFVPPLSVGWGLMWWILVIPLALLIIYSVVELPSSLDAVHNVAWRDWRKTPIYSRSGQSVPYIRWARRFALLVLVLLVALVALVATSPNTTHDEPGLAAPPATVVEAPEEPPAATEPAPASPVPATSSPADSNTPAALDSTCEGVLNPKLVDQPSKIKFGTGNLTICHNGEWQRWNQVNPGVQPPAEVTLRAWVQGGSYGYAIIVVDDSDQWYLVRTTDF